MKKVLITLPIVALLGLASCGGSDPGGDAKKLCTCMNGAVENPEKAGECAKMSDEMEAKYSGDEAATKEFDAAYKECFKEVLAP